MKRAGSNVSIERVNKPALSITPTSSNHSNASYHDESYDEEEEDDEHHVGVSTVVTATTSNMCQTKNNLAKRPHLNITSVSSAKPTATMKVPDRPFKQFGMESKQTFEEDDDIIIDDIIIESATIISPSQLLKQNFRQASPAQKNFRQVNPSLALGPQRQRMFSPRNTSPRGPIQNINPRLRQPFRQPIQNFRQPAPRGRPANTGVLPQRIRAPVLPRMRQPFPPSSQRCINPRMSPNVNRQPQPVQLARPPPRQPVFNSPQPRQRFQNPLSNSSPRKNFSHVNITPRNLPPKPAPPTVNIKEELEDDGYEDKEAYQNKPAAPFRSPQSPRISSSNNITPRNLRPRPSPRPVFQEEEFEDDEYDDEEYLETKTLTPPAALPPRISSQVNITPRNMPPKPSPAPTAVNYREDLEDEDFDDEEPYLEEQNVLTSVKSSVRISSSVNITPRNVPPNPKPIPQNISIVNMRGATKNDEFHQASTNIQGLQRLSSQVNITPRNTPSKSSPQPIPTVNIKQELEDEEEFEDEEEPYLSEPQSLPPESRFSSQIKITARNLPHKVAQFPPPMIPSATRVSSQVNITPRNLTAKPSQQVTPDIHIKKEKEDEEDYEEDPYPQEHQQVSSRMPQNPRISSQVNITTRNMEANQNQSLPSVGIKEEFEEEEEEEEEEENYEDEYSKDHQLVSSRTPQAPSSQIKISPRFHAPLQGPGSIVGNKLPSSIQITPRFSSQVNITSNPPNTFKKLNSDIQQNLSSNKVVSSLQGMPKVLPSIQITPRKTQILEESKDLVNVKVEQPDEYLEEEEDEYFDEMDNLTGGLNKQIEIGLSRSDINMSKVSSSVQIVPKVSSSVRITPVGSSSLAYSKPNLKDDTSKTGGKISNKNEHHSAVVPKLPVGLQITPRNANTCLPQSEVIVKEEPIEEMALDNEDYYEHDPDSFHTKVPSSDATFVGEFFANEEEFFNKQKDFQSKPSLDEEEHFDEDYEDEKIMQCADLNPSSSLKISSTLKIAQSVQNSPKHVVIEPIKKYQNISESIIKEEPPEEEHMEDEDWYQEEDIEVNKPSEPVQVTSTISSQVQITAKNQLNSLSIKPQSLQNVQPVFQSTQAVPNAAGEVIVAKNSNLNYTDQGSLKLPSSVSITPQTNIASINAQSPAAKPSNSVQITPRVSPSVQIASRNLLAVANTQDKVNVSSCPKTSKSNEQETSKTESGVQKLSQLKSLHVVPVKIQPTTDSVQKQNSSSPFKRTPLKRPPPPRDSDSEEESENEFYEEDEDDIEPEPLKCSQSKVTPTKMESPGSNKDQKKDTKQNQPAANLDSPARPRSLIEAISMISQGRLPISGGLAPGNKTVTPKKEIPTKIVSESPNNKMNTPKKENPSKPFSNSPSNSKPISKPIERSHEKIAQNSQDCEVPSLRETNCGLPEANKKVNEQSSVESDSPNIPNIKQNKPPAMKMRPKSKLIQLRKELKKDDSSKIDSKTPETLDSSNENSNSKNNLKNSISEANFFLDKSEIPDQQAADLDIKPKEANGDLNQSAIRKVEDSVSDEMFHKEKEQIEEPIHVKNQPSDEYFLKEIESKHVFDKEAQLGEEHLAGKSKPIYKSLSGKEEPFNNPLEENNELMQESEPNFECSTEEMALNENEIQVPLNEKEIRTENPALLPCDETSTMIIDGTESIEGGTLLNEDEILDEENGILDADTGLLDAQQLFQNEGMEIDENFDDEYEEDLAEKIMREQQEEEEEGLDEEEEDQNEGGEDDDDDNNQGGQQNNEPRNEGNNGEDDPSEDRGGNKKENGDKNKDSGGDDKKGNGTGDKEEEDKEQDDEEEEEEDEEEEDDDDNGEEEEEGIEDNKEEGQEEMKEFKKKKKPKKKKKKKVTSKRKINEDNSGDISPAKKSKPDEDETDKDKKDEDKEKDKDEGDKSSSSKAMNVRKNIRDVIDETQLDPATLAAQREEAERIKRVQEQQRQLREVQRQIAQNNKAQKMIGLLEGDDSDLSPGSSSKPSPVVVQLSAGSLNKQMLDLLKSQRPEDEEEELPADTSKLPNIEVDKLKKPLNITSSVSLVPVKKTPEGAHKKDLVTLSDSDEDCILISEPSDNEAEEEEDDPNNSGMHTNDMYNIPDDQGRVLINLAHDTAEPDIFLAPQIARIIKPHQIGGIRFLFDNIIESTERYKTSTGFGCILAHSMGLGKTLQIVSFSDIFLRHTDGKTIVCIMPINTLQNWVNEFNMWIPLPENVSKSPLLAQGEVRPREFPIFILNDFQKTLAARAQVIKDWHKQGGVLMIGYELYRQLCLKKPKKTRRGGGRGANSKEGAAAAPPAEEESDDKKQVLLQEIFEALVNPGPDLVICDEGHRIKNSHASTSLALKQMRTRRRVVLTGYPLQNNLLEYWCMVDFVRPNYLGSKTEFSNMFERPIQNGQCVDSTPKDVRLMRHRAHVLHSLLQGFVQRRSHMVLQKTLPVKQEYVLLIRMTPLQRQLYDTFMNEVVRTKTVPNPLKAFAVCCKIWNHPDVLYNFLKKRLGVEDVVDDLDIEEASSSIITTGSEPSITGTGTSPATSKRGRGGAGRGRGGSANKNSRKGSPRKGGSEDAKSPAVATVMPQPNTVNNPPAPGAPFNQNSYPNMSAPMSDNFNYQQNNPYSNSNNFYGNDSYWNQPTPYSSTSGYQTDTTSSSFNDSSMGMTPDPYSNNYNNYDYNSHNSNMSSSTYDSGMMPSSQNYMGDNMFNANSNNGMFNPNTNNAGFSHSSSNNLGFDSSMNQNSSLFNSSAVDNTNVGYNSTFGTNNNTPSYPNSDVFNAGGDLGGFNSSGFNQNSNFMDKQQTSQPMTNLTTNGSAHLDQSGRFIDDTFKDMSLSNNFETIDRSQNKLHTSGQVDNSSNNKMEDLPSDMVNTEAKSQSETTNDIPGEVKLNAGELKSVDEEKPGDKKDVDEKTENKSDEGSKPDATPAKKEDPGIPYDWAERLMKDYMPGLIEASNKMVIFITILEQSIIVGDRMLVFSQSLFTLTLIEHFLHRRFVPGRQEKWARNRNYFRLDGSTISTDREKLINEFNSNPNFCLFLVSTRAGSLGINLVGANRVIVFDASWNPCHDTQAVCRVYRYGQQKPCFVYRLVMDSCLEKKIYDRQINKQGMADRVVDECNPDAHLSIKEVTNLCWDNEPIPEEKDFSHLKDNYVDDIVKLLVEQHSFKLSKQPFQHESLLVDRKDKKLSTAEKRLAKRSYEMEKQANTKPQFGGYRNMSGKPMASVRPMQGNNMIREGVGAPRNRQWIPAEVWQKQGMSAQEMTLPLDVVIPTNSNERSIVLKAGQKVMVLKSPKGIYMQLENGKIIAIRTANNKGGAGGSGQSLGGLGNLVRPNKPDMMRGGMRAPMRMSTVPRVIDSRFAKDVSLSPVRNPGPRPRFNSLMSNIGRGGYVQRPGMRPNLRSASTNPRLRNVSITPSLKSSAVSLTMVKKKTETVSTETSTTLDAIPERTITPSISTKTSESSSPTSSNAQETTGSDAMGEDNQPNDKPPSDTHPADFKDEMVHESQTQEESLEPAMPLSTAPSVSDNPEDKFSTNANEPVSNISQTPPYPAMSQPEFKDNSLVFSTNDKSLPSSVVNYDTPPSDFGFDSFSSTAAPYSSHLPTPSFPQYSNNSSSDFYSPAPTSNYSSLSYPDTNVSNPAQSYPSFDMYSSQDLYSIPTSQTLPSSLPQYPIASSSSSSVGFDSPSFSNSAFRRPDVTAYPPVSQPPPPYEFANEYYNTPFTANPNTNMPP